MIKVGADFQQATGCTFTVWAPEVDQVSVKLVAPVAQTLPMQAIARGYWQINTPDAQPGTQYLYQLGEGQEFPDPASHFQPEGVHGPSQVVDHSQFQWSDQNWQGIPLAEMVIYELHVGTFTSDSTFTGIIPKLKDLAELGVNTIEIMPVAQFPGSRNWGYDGVYPYAVQSSYGGPEGLKALVDACHAQGMAVVLDVVYNHFGPEGNYISNFGPYFTDTYRTPWGSAVNFDDTHSDGVRNYFIGNARHWFEHYHLDGLRLDAIHAIYDLGAKHLLREMAESIAELSQSVGRKLYLIAESDLNDVRVINPWEQGGHGMDAQWSDDFHHVVHTLLTQEQIGYYQDYGSCTQLAKVLKQGFAYDWEYSGHRQRYHGSDASDRPGEQFVVCTQNHDQVGNRMLGERLSDLTSFAGLKLAAGVLMLAPNVPMLFMGEEYGETAPFLYFVSHSDPDLVEAVRAGRKREFAAFHMEGEYDDPQSEQTFAKSQLNWQLREQGHHNALWRLYQRLIELRRTLPALQKLDKTNLTATAQEADKLVVLHRWQPGNQILALFNFQEQALPVSPELPAGDWQKVLDSEATEWQGSGSTLPERLEPGKSWELAPQSFVLYQSA